MKGNYEILAPAGSEQQLTAAVNNGCNSVYLGLDGFNARMKAPNFTAQNIGQWVDYCHFFGVKVYVTVNTSLKNEEFDSARKMLITAYENNADGVIVTDLALLKFAATLPKPFEVVASTQLNAHDDFGARFLKKLGATTVVCARESTLEEIRRISQSGVNTECFLHGALCVCQSGQCLFSSMVGGNSGNRGLCAQPCRKLYKSNIGKFTKGAYLLSPCDNCGLQTAERLLKSGVTTFKIEGRNRRAEYAGITSAVYSKFFADGFKSDNNMHETLCEAYNRGNLPACNYLYGKNDGIIFPSAQNHIGVAVGKVVKGGVKCAVPLTKGDGLKILDGEKEVCGGVALESGSGVVRVSFSGKVAEGMTVRRTTDVLFCEQTLNARKKLPVSLHLRAFADEKAQLFAQCNGTNICVESEEFCQKAQNASLSEQQLKQQLCKPGDWQYTISDIAIKTNGIFMPKSQINALRRKCFQVLHDEIIAEYNSKFSARKNVLPSECDYTVHDDAQLMQKPCLAVICNNVRQIDEALTVADYVILKSEMLDEKCVEDVDGKGVFLYLPSFSDNGYLRKILEGKKVGIVCHNVGQVQLARELNLKYIAGSGLNIYNDYMAEIFEDAETFFYSQELTLKEISLFRNKTGIVFVDGQLTLMKLVHCPYKVVFGGTCADCKAEKPLRYTDELGNEFYFCRYKDSRCTFELCNGKKLSAVGKLHESGRYCVDFNRDVMKHYLLLNKGKEDGYTEQQPFTRGRLFSKIN